MPTPTDTMTTASCECEHVSHMDQAYTTVGESRPRERSSHAYGHVCDIENMTELRTDWGTFRVCVKCAEDHHMKI